MRRALASLIAASLLAASLVLSTAGSAAAAEQTIDPVSCALQGGTIHVKPGDTITIFEGWIADSYGQVVSFTDHVTWVLTINGVPQDVTPYLTSVINLGPYWGQLFFYPAGPIGAHETWFIHYDNLLKVPVYDGFFHYPSGSVYNGGFDCTITTFGR